MSKNTKQEERSKFEQWMEVIGFIVSVSVLCIFAGMAWGYGRSLVLYDPIQDCIDGGLKVSWERDYHEDEQLVLVCKK